jgi:hypothetical protein
MLRFGKALDSMRLEYVAYRRSSSIRFGKHANSRQACVKENRRAFEILIVGTPEFSSASETYGSSQS